MTASPPPSPAERLVLISFLDVVDRTDLLFHEIRQLQTALIYQLGIPELFGVLRFEEAYLWGDLRNGRHLGSWTDKLQAVLDIRSESRELAKAWTVRYPLSTEPSPPRPDPSTSDTRDEAQRLFDATYDVMQIAANGGHLTVDLRRVYFMLAELQVIKQNLLREKIITVHAGLRAYDRLPRPPRSQAEGEANRLKGLILTCWALREQLAVRVPRVGNLQRQVEQMLDVAIEQDPRPSVARRRDQGIYTNAVITRCVQLQVAMAGMLDILGAEDPLQNGPAGSGPHPRGRRTQPVIMHRWDLVAMSRWDQEIDAIHLDEAWNPRRRPLDPDRYNALRFVNSSYWMPDRPEMQPQLAHEVAHMELDSRYYGFTINYIAGAQDRFARMVNAVRAVIDIFVEEAASIPGFWQLDHNDKQPLLLEISTDVLSTLAIGPGYLFTMFLDLQGKGFEGILQGFPGTPDFDLDIEREIFERLRDVTAPPSWYVRFLAVIGLLDAMKRHARQVWDQIPLADDLREGVAEAVDQFFRAFRDGALETDQPRWDHWAGMSQSIAQVLRDGEGKTLVIGLRNERCFAGRDQDLGDQVATILRGPMLDRFAEDPRYLHGLYRARFEAKLAGKTAAEVAARLKADPDLHSMFKEAYLGHIDPVMLFRSVFDIPWQFALMTTIDFLQEPTPRKPFTLASCKGSSAGKWLRAVHRLNWLGRDVFQLGLEFWVWNTGRGPTRLDTALRVVKAMLDETDETWNPASLHRLRQWAKRIDAARAERKADGWGPYNVAADVRRLRTLARRLHAIAPPTADAWNAANDPRRLRLRLAQLRDYVRWSGIDHDPVPALATALGHAPGCKLGTAVIPAIGTSRNYRLERLASRSPLVPITRPGASGHAPRLTSGSFHQLFTSPWVDSIDSRSGPSIGGDPPRSKARCLPLLGRYDLMRVEEARTVGPSSLPFFSVQERFAATAAAAPWPPITEQEAIQLQPGDRLVVGATTFDLACTVVQPPPISGPKTVVVTVQTPRSDTQVRASTVDVSNGAWRVAPGVSLSVTAGEATVGLDGYDYVTISPPTPDAWSTVAIPLAALRSPHARANDETRRPIDEVLGSGDGPSEPFFVRQQFGLPFQRSWTSPHDTEPGEIPGVTKQLAWARIVHDAARAEPGPSTADRHPSRAEWFIPPEETVGLAALSVQVAQRTARLTLVQQLVDPASPGPWAAFRDSNGADTHPDHGFIIDGWGDVLCILNADDREMNTADGTALLPTIDDLTRQGAPYWTTAEFDHVALHRNITLFHQRLLDRLMDVVALRNALFDHFLVSRTELAYTPLAGDLALRTMLDPAFVTSNPAQDSELHWSFQLSVRPDRSTGNTHRNIRQRVEHWASDWTLRRSLMRGIPPTQSSDPQLHEAIALRVVRQAGAMDYRISFLEPSKLQGLNRLVFGEDGALIHAYKTLAQDLKPIRDRDPGAFENIKAGRVFIPAAALLLSSMFDDLAAEGIDHTFTTLGIRGITPPNPAHPPHPTPPAPAPATDRSPP